MAIDSSKQRYLQRLWPVVEYVRSNPRGDLRLDALSRMAHLSPYHFHRVFAVVMGETVGSFVRRTRLERAAHLMRTAPDRPLRHIAYAAGFSSLSHFSRTFRKHYGTSPSRWDRRSLLQWSQGEAETSLAAEFAASAAADGGPEPEVDIRETPALTLAFVRVPSMFEPGARQHGYERLREWLRQRELQEAQLLAMSWTHVELARPEVVSCDFCASVPAGTRGGNGVAIREFPPLVVAASGVQGGHARLVRAWYRLYDWLAITDFEPCNQPIFTRFNGWPERVEDTEFDLECCIPLKSLAG